jgi:hypothetical protein
MKKLSRCAIAVFLSCQSFAGVGLAQQKVNPDALLLQDFKERVDRYMELHNRLEKQAPRLKETEDPAQIKASQDGLASKIREARAGARQGDIFTADVARLFRRLLSPEVKGRDGAETKAAIKDDAPPPGTVVLKVNARYPDNAPLPTVPPNILASLPELPKDLEYRIVGNALILRDVHANVIVDFIPKAIG